MSRIIPNLAPENRTVMSYIVQHTDAS